MRKKILFFAMTLLLLTGITASADVLGEQNGGWSTYMGAFTSFIMYSSIRTASVSKMNIMLNIHLMRTPYRLL